MEETEHHTINNFEFELPKKYKPIKMIGRGTFGAVISATNQITGDNVAIKKLAKIEDLIDGK
jgi:serine/threonine protein kinase